MVGNTARARIMRRAVGAGAAALLVAGLAACSSESDNGGSANGSGGNGGSGGDGEVPVVSVWAWYPNFESVVTAFNETHDNVQIEWTNAGVSDDVYAVLRTALESGSGAPDVTQMEFSELPAFVVNGSVVDISPYGANDLRDEYPEWAWNQISDGDSVYAIPVDAGPIAMFYRADLYEEYGLTPAETWDEYADQAVMLQEQNPDVWISDFQVGNASNLQGLIQQAGSVPYSYSFANPDEIMIDFDNEITRKVLNYWGDLVLDGHVDREAYHSTEWDTKLAAGDYLTTIEAAWRPGYLSGVAASTAGEWRAAPMPQWEAGANAFGNHGGSTFAVTNQASDEELAAYVAMELFGNDATWEVAIEEAFLFPTWRPVAESDDFLSREYEFFGGQRVNEEVFVPSSDAVVPLQFTPFDSFAKRVINEEVADGMAGVKTMDEAAAQIQARLVEYAESVGLTVNP